MPLPEFPSSIIGYAEISGGLDDPFLEDQFESGARGGRPMFTKPRPEPYTMRFPLLSDAEFAVLKEFYESTRGQTFLLTHHDGSQEEVSWVSNTWNWRKSWQSPEYNDVTLKVRAV